MFPHRHILRLWAGLLLSLLCCALPPAKGQNTRHEDSLTAALAATRTDTAKAKILLYLAAVHNADDVTRKFYYAEEALELSDKAGWQPGIMYAERTIGDCYNNVLAYDDALTHFRRSIAASHKAHRPDIEATCLQFMFHSYNQKKQLDSALACQAELVALVAKTSDKLNECNQRSAYALCLKDMGRYNESIASFRNNIVFAQQHLEGRVQADKIADILNSLATAYVSAEKPDSALQCLRQSKDIVLAMKDETLLAYINSSFCDVYMATHNTDSAIFYGERTVAMATALNIMKLQREYCRILAMAYEEAGRAAPALRYYRAADSLSLVLGDAKKTIEDAANVSRIGMQHQEEHNRKEQQSLETIKRNQQAALTAAIAAVVLLVVLVALIYRNLQQKQKANKTISRQADSLQQQNELIDKALKEKEMLLKETHHRVKNNLQLISSLLELQAANLADDSAKEALKAAQRRVLSIATVHSKLYGNDDNEQIEFSAFANDLCQRLYSAFAGEGQAVQFNPAIPETFLRLDTTVLLGIILNELITNSFKHAHPATGSTAIEITMMQEEEHYRLRYHDNGPGLPEGIFEAETGSLGLYLVRRLSKQLRGTATYEYEAGSTFTIIFPHAG